MEEDKLYKTIFKRRSIRNFDLAPLDKNTLIEIAEHIKTLIPLHKDIKTEFWILPPEVVKRRTMKKAPHYLAAFSQVKEGYLSNVGFLMQQMDLFFSAQGLGSCWQGIPRLKKEVLENSDLEFIILMPFGKAQEPLHRTDISQFKRKQLTEITDISGANEILEAARVAPSATNAQPWFFTGDKNLIHAYYKEPGRVKGLFTKKYPPIDVGISLYHLKVAAEHFGKKTEVLFDKNIPKDIKEEYTYVASLKLSN